MIFNEAVCRASIAAESISVVTLLKHMPCVVPHLHPALFNFLPHASAILPQEHSPESIAPARDILSKALTHAVAASRLPRPSRGLHC